MLYFGAVICTKMEILALNTYCWLQFAVVPLVFLPKWVGWHGQNNISTSYSLMFSSILHHVFFSIFCQQLPSCISGFPCSSLCAIFFRARSHKFVFFKKRYTSRAKILSRMSSTISCHYEKKKKTTDFGVVIKLSSLHQKSLNNIQYSTQLFICSRCYCKADI